MRGVGLLRNVGPAGGRRPTALAPFFVRTLPDPLFERCKPVFMDQLQPSTNYDTLSEAANDIRERSCSALFPERHTTMITLADQIAAAQRALA